MTINEDEMAAREVLYEMMIDAVKDKQNADGWVRELVEMREHRDDGELIKKGEGGNNILLWSTGALVYVDWKHQTMPVGRRFVTMQLDEIGYYFVGEYYGELVEEDGSDVWQTTCTICGTDLLDEEKVYRKLHDYEGDRIIEKENEESYCEACAAKDKVREAL